MVDKREITCLNAKANSRYKRDASRKLNLKMIIMIDNIPVINAVRPTAFEIQEIKKNTIGNNMSHFW